MADAYRNSVTDEQGRPKTGRQQGRSHDESGALAVEDKMRNANLGGGSIDSSIPKPKRDSFPAGLGGEASYQNAVRAWQRKALKSPAEQAQKRALGGM
jgi:hypothetical protein